MNDAHNAGNYTWAAGLFVGLGMSAFDITLGIFTGSLIIMVGCIPVRPDGAGDWQAEVPGDRRIDA